MYTVHGGDHTSNIWISRFFQFSLKLFQVTGTPFTQVKPNVKFLGLPLWERISRTTSTTVPNRIRLGPKVPS